MQAAELRGTPYYVEVLQSLCLLEPNMSELDVYLLAGKVLDVCERDLNEENFAIQDERKAEGVADWYLYGVSLLEFLQGTDADYHSEVRRRLGR